MPYVDGSLTYFGNGSLYMPHGAGSLQVHAAAPVSHFRMRAWFWDSGSVGSAHFMSPNHDTCPLDMGKKLVPHVAVGTYTLSQTTEYCLSAPWQNTGESRVNQWHMFEIVGGDETTDMYIDGVWVGSGPAVMLDKVHLSSGMGSNGLPHPAVSQSHAYWDEVSVLLDAPITVGDMLSTEFIAWSPERAWKKVETKGVPPAPRYSHTSVTYDGGLYVFGGERSAYSFNDLWRLDMKTMEWSIAPLSTNESPPARFDHSAVVVEDHMIIYGGRSGNIFLGDMWAYSFTNMNWTWIAGGNSSTGSEVPGLRFGHSAVVEHNKDMYIFGGYTDSGFSNEFIRCSVTEDPVTCVDLTNGCPSVPGSDAVPAGLSARYSHTMYADSTNIFVYGGSSLEDETGFSAVYKFALEACTWEEIPALESIGRYEHITGVIDGQLLVQGGHGASVIDDTTYSFPLK